MRPINTFHKDPGKMSNEEWVVHLMNHHPAGGIIQSFVIEALRLYSRIVAQQDPVNFKDPEQQVINPMMWRAMGIDVYQQVLRKYGQTEEDKVAIAIIQEIQTRVDKERKEKEEKDRLEAGAKKSERPEYKH